MKSEKRIVKSTKRKSRLRDFSFWPTRADSERRCAAYVTAESTPLVIPFSFFLACFRRLLLTALIVKKNTTHEGWCSFWPTRADSNRWPSESESDALSSCATGRYEYYSIIPQHPKKCKPFSGKVYGFCLCSIHRKETPSQEGVSGSFSYYAVAPSVAASVTASVATVVSAAVVSASFLMHSLKMK